LTLSEAKNHLRVTHDLEDALIGALIEAGTEWAESYTGRAMSELLVAAQTSIVALEHTIEMLLPIATIESVVDADNNPVAYTFKPPNRVVLTEMAEHPLTITYTTSPQNVPEVCKVAILLRIGDMYDYRTDRYVPLTREGAVRRVAEDLLQPYKLLQFQ
jgi:hypothetical protein